MVGNWEVIMGIEKIKPEFNRDYDYFYSASASGFVYRPYSEPGDYPDDLKPVSDELHNQMFKGQANGKQIVADENGLPMLADPPPPTPEELQQQAESEKRYRMSQATNAIAPLQDAVELDMATSEEKAALTEWRKYRVLLNRVDCSTAPDIAWPEPPK
ncbi:tail fiber assembly protein [Xenorhabdus budapestensis]|uniref:Tail fiber assembly protein n=2 Tax=Xenorhabdus budapestensis TaxID=290110 RepID=A0ABX7VKB2_XENBU|nr:tail fiber assembly protein [Xenorhabdus budapestensis]QTL41033.1 tail fiber assembly protein [Xenorhabdus budapestensis]